MKKRLVLSLLLPLLAGCAFAQQVSGGGASLGHPVDLQTDLERYKQVSLARDVDGLLSFLHPALFTQTPKEQMKAMMQKALLDGTAPKIEQIEFQVVSPVQPYSLGQMVRVKAQSKLSMQRPGDATPQIDGLMIGLIKERMGKDVVASIDEEKNIISIQKTSWMLGVNEGGAGWKFIDKDRLEYFIKNRLLPDDLVAALQ